MISLRAGTIFILFTTYSVATSSFLVLSRCSANIYLMNICGQGGEKRYIIKFSAVGKQVYSYKSYFSFVEG